MYSHLYSQLKSASTGVHQLGVYRSDCICVVDYYIYFLSEELEMNDGVDHVTYLIA